MFEDFRRDVRDDFSQIFLRLDRFVLREVYDAERSADREQIKDLKRQADAKSREVRNAVLAATSAVVAAIVVAVLTKSGVWQ